MSEGRKGDAGRLGEKREQAVQGRARGEQFSQLLEASDLCSLGDADDGTLRRRIDFNSPPVFFHNWPQNTREKGMDPGPFTAHFCGVGCVGKTHHGLLVFVETIHPTLNRQEHGKD